MISSAHRRDRGAVTAEVAVALPVMVLVLAACLGGLGLAAAQVRAQDAAADAARLLGRGDSIAAAQQHVKRVTASARLTVSRPSGLVCTTVHLEHWLMLIPIVLTASSCALDGGR